LKHIDEKNINGPIALIGDNLGSHFSEDVIEQCERRGNLKYT